MIRTYDRATIEAAGLAWTDGEYGRAWDRVRAIAAARGMLYPPTGTPHDDREVERPSQRAIIWRAMEDNPRSLVRILGRSSTWNDVVRGIVGLEERLRQEADERELEEAARGQAGPTREDATEALRGILARLGEAS